MPPTPGTFRDCIILTGPTGSGKTALGMELAEQINAEIIAADSMTLYRGMDIGTAKPTSAERERVRHHLIDVLDPGESSSVAWWLERAGECVVDIQSRGKKVLVVGGTPFYLKAMLYGLFESPPADEELRRRLELIAEQDGPESLHRRLQDVDPASAQKLHVNDVRRVVRALEVFELTGQPLCSFQTQWTDPGEVAQSGRPIQIICLDVLRQELYDRIDRRVEAMIAVGWLEEVRRLRQHELSRQAAEALGYEELGQVLDGAMALADAVALIQLRSRQFAKRQLTWFRNWRGLQWIRPELTLLCQALTIEERKTG
jgi:tRNA dimethylallyltransferase